MTPNHFLRKSSITIQSHDETCYEPPGTSTKLSLVRDLTINMKVSTFLTCILYLSRSWGCEDLRSLSLDWRGQNFLLPTFHSQIPIYCLRRRGEVDRFQIHKKCLWCFCMNAPWNNTCSDRSATRSGNSLTSIQPRIWASTRSSRQSVGYCYFSRPCACVLEIWAISQEAKEETISNSIVRILWIIQRSYVTRHEGEGLGFNSQWRYITSISASSVTPFFSASLQCIKYDSQVAVEVLAQKKVISWLCFVVQYIWVGLFTRPSAYCVWASNISASYLKNLEASLKVFTCFL